jgi:hypothetical protein
MLYALQMTPMFSDYWVNTRGISASEGALCWGPVTLGFAVSALVTGKLIQRSAIHGEAKPFRSFTNIEFVLTGLVNIFGGL